MLSQEQREGIIARLRKRAREEVEPDIGDIPTTGESTLSTAAPARGLTGRRQTSVEAPLTVERAVSAVNSGRRERALLRSGVGRGVAMRRNRTPEWE
jgi:hypothetical protein